MENLSLTFYFCVVEIKRKLNLLSFQMWVSQTFGEETSSATEINMMISTIFIFLQRVYFLNLFAAIFVYVIMTPVVEIVVLSLS